MIERAAGTAVSLVLAAGAARAAEPMMGDFFGRPFEVPSMIAALFGCIVTRVIIGQSDKVSRWLVRVPIDVLTGGVTFVVIASTQLSMLAALTVGITIASLGATIIKLAEARGRRVLDALLPGGPDNHAAGIDRAVEHLDKTD